MIPELTNYDWLYGEHWNLGKSTRQIAEELHTYTNKVIRAMRRLGIAIRNPSEAQKNALTSGRQQHPTKGKHRSEKTKIKISEQVAKQWKTKTPEELAKFSQLNKDKWNNMPQEKKDEIHHMAAKAIRKSADEGSILERFISKELQSLGYVVDYHKNLFLANQKLQLDIFLPEHSVAIEIDGPSHFLPIWGEESLLRNIKAADEKNGLLVSQGIYVLRVKHIQPRVTQKIKRDTLQGILNVLKTIKTNPPCVILVDIDEKELPNVRE